MLQSDKAEPDSTVDPDEVAQFDRLGEEWWDIRGPMRALHRFNPVRVDYLVALATRYFKAVGRPLAGDDRPFAGLEMLDIGCGGGLFSEPLARLGAQMTAIDPAPHNIEVARRHAEKSGLGIDYEQTTAEALAATGRTFDVVLCMEVIEHVRDVKNFVAVAASLVRPQGFLVAATLNRTLKSFALAIFGAEYILRWVPKGTHKWEHFVTPRELAAALRAAKLHVVDATGVVYEPFTGRWRQSRDMDVNYIMAAERKG
ncbi:MAG: bifunctional 2-polyprenyl-6-hydroxyphenol methylase/3-demethylubiquinol 3-O-methyltransferase UbiG [Beijerinckiaceae bacterium]